ncbi:hypothetical protein KC19_4G203600 [Ceratodon purpureus]|uniref:Ubiquitin-like protease family profile domain-containing protein n=1 Tax=Ceratodon purpureus TaxID=3225 RepID=A0A8T0ID70_CERPU|nr:hypothetical protein KC19_4G203600 [Ceratodon purpureus]
MAARATENDFGHQYQFAARWNPQGEVGVLQGDGSSLASFGAIGAPPMRSDIASRAHTDTSVLHVEHDGAFNEGYEHAQSIPRLELNFGILEDTASGHDQYQQLHSGDTFLGNDPQDQFLTFPAGEVGAVTISACDLEGLQPTRFLSNNIIDFYIKYLERRLSSEDRNRFYFFNSFFFTKLVGNSGTSTDIEECDVAYDQVRKWTGEENLFEKDFIFIPILRSSHWSLIIICHLSGLTSSPDKSKVSPCILHLDPIERKHESFREQVRSFLYQACSERYQDSNKKDEMLYEVAFRMKYERSKVPQQDNGYDCGLYVLHYVETFLLEATAPNFDFASSKGERLFINYPHFEEAVSAKRMVIQTLIYEFSHNLEGHAARSMNIQPKPQPKRLPKHSPRPQPKRLSKHTKGENKISKKWNEKETSFLLNRMVAIGRIRKGSEGPTHWELISQEIQAKLGTTRLEDECRRRYDTLLKAYKRVKKTGKPFCDITDAERHEVKLATPLIEEWYKAIDTICLQRGSDNRKPRKRAKPSSEPERTSRKQVAIPGFSALGEDLRSTLLHLIQDLLLKYSGWKSSDLNVVCQRLAIVQDQRPSEIQKFIFKLLELKLVNIVSYESEPYLNVSNLRVYKKFVETVLRKNPDFDIYLQVCENYDSVSLPEVPHSVSLQPIRVLSLYGCHKLEHADLSCLSELRTLHISECGSLRAVTGWEAVKKLGWLEIRHCKFYVDFPPLRCLPSLREFYYISDGVAGFEMMPVPDFSQCNLLRSLQIWSHKSWAVNSMDLSSLRFLEVLTFFRCSGLSGLHSLTTLKLRGCSALRRVPELGCLKALTLLDMRWSGVEETPGLQDLHLLTQLHLGGCESLKALPHLGHLKALTCLDISWTAIEEILGIEELLSLESLDCYDSNLKRLPDLHHLPRLREVGIDETPLSKMDPSSFYHGKDKILFNSNVEKKEFVDEISDVSDLESNDGVR